MPGIKVNPKILAEWTRLAADGLTDLDMSFSSDAPAERSIEVLRGAVDVLVAEHNETIAVEHPEPGKEPPYPGEWHMIELTDGSLGIRVFECERADIFIPKVVAALERAGIAGKLAPLKWPATPTPPIDALVLECRLLVRGRRRHQSGRTYHWIADPPSRAWLIDLAATWLRGSGDERSAPALRVSVLPTISLAPTDDLAARILSNVDGWNEIDARVATGSGFRMIKWSPDTRQIALIHVGSKDWAEPLEGLRRALLDGSERIAYGYIKRGSSPAAALNDESLLKDWVPRDGYPPRDTYSRTPIFFYNEYAPDAFAIQLLGPGYAGRIPEVPSYNRQSVGDAAMLEHKDLGAWYDHPFVKPSVGVNDVTDVAPPPVLAGARADLAPILFRPELIPDA